MQNQREIKSLTEILRENPEAQAYFRKQREYEASMQPYEPPPPPQCETCDGRGFVRTELPVGHPKFGQLFPCPNPNCPILAAQRAERYAKLCTLAQIPEEYAHLSLGTWKELFEVAPEFREGKLAAYGAVLAFIEARDSGFYFTLNEASGQVGIEVPDFDSARRCSIALTGTFGVGKTSLAVCAMRELLDQYHVQVVYLLMGEFFQALQERFVAKDEYEYGGEASDEAELMRTYQQAPVLVMDEFPLKPGKSDWWQQQVYSLINYRHIHHMPTIITTNFNWDILTESWGGMIGSRLHTMAHWIEMSGLELRRRDATWKAQP